ncbi:unnamed protein product [Phaedon cochleariae]|uniref:DUF4371 domain-containing protein n=1 Tax=Phaedon cochleariae TaxID=80249 RepID=A0A9P0DZ36_PHACE|nr:unnamed protein product [Phaedon cochleariae]
MERYLIQIPSKATTASPETPESECLDAALDPTLEHFQKAPKAPCPSIQIDDETERTNKNKDEPKKLKQTFQQKYNKSWESRFPWLLSKDERKISCKCCNAIITCNLSHIKRHENTGKHQRLYKKSISTPQLSSLKKVREVNKLNKKTQIAEYKLLMFLHEHNLPFLLMDHIPKMLSSAFPDTETIKNLKCSRTKATLITKECLATQALDDIAADTQNCYYSLIVDETTDVSTKKSLAIVIRYHNGTYVKDRFLCLSQVNSCYAGSLFKTVCDVLRQNKIPFENLVGFDADNASVMMGDKSGLKARFRDINQNIFVIGCVCHSFALCSSSACLKLPRSLEEFIRQIYNHFANSSKRLEDLHQFQSFLNQKPYKMLHPAQTRWLSLQAVVDRVLLSWDALKLYFTSAVMIDGLRSSQTVLDSLNTPIVKIYLLFLNYISNIVNKLNLEFQSEKPKIYILSQRISELFRTLLRNYINVTHLNTTELDNISPSNPDHFLPIENMYFGSKVQIMIQEVNDPQEIQKFRVNALAFYVELCCQIKKRFNFNDPLLTFLSNFSVNKAISGEILSITEIAQVAHHIGWNPISYWADIDISYM